MPVAQSHFCNYCSKAIPRYVFDFDIEFIEPHWGYRLEHICEYNFAEIVKVAGIVQAPEDIRSINITRTGDNSFKMDIDFIPPSTGPSTVEINSQLADRILQCSESSLYKSEQRLHAIYQIKSMSIKRYDWQDIRTRGANPVVDRFKEQPKLVVTNQETTHKPTITKVIEYKTTTNLINDIEANIDKTKDFNFTINGKSYSSSWFILEAVSSLITKLLFEEKED